MNEKSLARFIHESLGLEMKLIQEALDSHRRTSQPFIDLLLKTGAASEEELLEVLAQRFNLPLFKNLKPRLSVELAGRVPINYFKKYTIAPLNLEDGVLTVAVNDPYMINPVDEMRLFFNCLKVNRVLATRREILACIHRFYDQAGDTSEEVIQDLDAGDEASGSGDAFGETEDLLDATSEAPIIRLVNHVLTQAAKRQASDIHIEPYQKDLKVRYRIDGILYEILSPPKRFQSAITSRIKIMANLNIAEKRLPQDGRIQIRVANKDIDIRVSIIPTAFGERIVLRLLDKTAALLGLEELGFGPKKLTVFRSLISRVNGIILVTGPTGSGKSTTLYAALNELNSVERNIITVEDPIEYQLYGVGQIQVNPKINLTFAKGLRAILRHDPDVIMVGEIRDLETVEIAIQASLTGHLVFSTLHTNDSAGAVTRLVDMGVEPFLISSAVVGVVAQRLVRIVCPKCREAYHPSAEELAEINLSPRLLDNRQLFRGRGCGDCFDTGYRGRTSIYEIMVMTDRIRSLVLKGADANQIRQAAIAEGMATLKQDGTEKLLAGATTVAEVLRVTQD
ncbi:MAG: type II secretion system ATPase GspE [Deltaproteobacteria bacterium]|nr:type II secretion system ATPase GspE [Deltaproteobacteria bacterium]MBF0525435.1 type II secretion system ATPase GspE [Deltaproteobacteria bacterium]